MAGGDVLQVVRQSLDDLGYREPLPPDSLSLVQHLLDDLINSIRELKETKTNLAQTQKVSVAKEGLKGSGSNL